MLKGLGDLGQIMKLQREMKAIQKKLKNSTAHGESADGFVKATINGEFKVLNIEIAEDFLRQADKRKIEKTIMAALNTAIDGYKENAAKEMSKITGGMNIPGMGNLFD